MIDTSRISLAFDYESEQIEDIKRCLMTLYSTKEGEQPLDREFGLNMSFLGLPIQLAESQFTLECIRKTSIYERRASVTEVTFKEDGEGGALVPTIHLSKGVDLDE